MPEKYHFVFIWVFSYIYNFIHIFSNIINFYWKKETYISFINNINFHNKKVFVFLYTTDYKDIQQRPQHLANAFSKIDDCLVFFMTKNQTKDNVEWIEKINNSFYLVNNYKIVNLIKSYNLIITWPSNFIFLHYLKNYNKLIYDFPDELDFFPWLSRKIVEQYHFKILKQADLITPSADYLESLIKNDYKQANTTIVLNWVFPNDFIIGENKKEYIPDELRQILNWNKVIWFYWWLWEWWFDFELLKYCANNKKDYQFIIIWWGNIETLISKYAFNKNSNVFFLWPKKYLELKYYAKQFDVSLIPFKLNQFTLWVSPVKSFEYMVQWIPFVSTDLPECRKYENVLIWKDYDDFLKKIDIWIQLKENINYIKKLKLEWCLNTWENRANLIINKLYNE